jgi:hypothetical protein
MANTRKTGTTSARLGRRSQTESNESTSRRREPSYSGRDEDMGFRRDAGMRDNEYRGDYADRYEDDRGYRSSPRREWQSDYNRSDMRSERNYGRGEEMDYGRQRSSYAEEDRYERSRGEEPRYGRGYRDDDTQDRHLQGRFGTEEDRDFNESRGESYRGTQRDARRQGFNPERDEHREFNGGRRGSGSNYR